MADEYELDARERRLRLSERREERFQRAQARRERGTGPAGYARKITNRSGDYSGKGVLAGELIIGFILILIRIVADFEVSDDGTSKGNVLHPTGQYGPLPIAAGLVGSFFLLSFLAIAGGTRAKIAVILGGCIVLSLGVNSLAEIEKISTTLGAIGSIAVPSASGTEESGAVTTAPTPTGTSTSSPNTGTTGTTGTVNPGGPNVPQVMAPGPPKS